MSKFASTVALVVGGADISGWMLTALTITFVVFAPPVSQASDYWGRRWLLIILTVSGCVGTIITSRAQSVWTSLLRVFDIKGNKADFWVVDGHGNSR